MMRAAIFIAFIVLAAWPARANGPTIVDANIVTGIDVSGSMVPESIRIEIDGIAMAIQSPDVLAAIQRGNHGRIGFLVYLWADGGMPVVCAWRIIANAGDAAAAAAELTAVTADLTISKVNFGTLTNLTDSILNAAALMKAAPFLADRSIVNIVTDGAPTKREADVPMARSMLLATGATLNGVIVGGDDKSTGYFRTQVIGGRGSFVLTASKAESLVYAMRRKFIADLSMAMP